ncbi:MAG: hypothetical protein HND52_05150 [Ignavibacteriae bacterium]|nr:hypothetical protein [Ignavibacteriota bacterium]NOG97341.1 hypothetical protein [Ignavibacteriota bacterium]
MRKLILIVCAIFISSNISAQTDTCGTLIPDNVLVEYAQSGDLSLYKRTTITPPLRLAIHIVRYSNGSGGISQAELDQKVAGLNSDFQQAFFEFYVYKIDYIDNDNFASITDMEEANSLREINHINGCINVYFVPFLASLEGLSSFSPRIQEPVLIQTQGILVQNNASLTTLPHEMGHYFDLFHTHETLFNVENIARTGGCSNWSYSGDLLKDTPADFGGRVSFSYINNNCQYDPKKPPPPDGCGSTNYAPLTNNMMITELKICRTTFTEQQKDRMNETLLLHRSELLLQNLVLLKNDIENNNAGGALHLEATDYNSGEYVPVDDGVYTIGTDNERFVNYLGSGANYKHINWNLTSSDKFLSRSVSITSDDNQIAHFKELEHSKVELILEGQTFLDKGLGQFQDPWYVLSNASQPGNYWISFISSYEPTGKESAAAKGVFLNQGTD